MQQSIARAAARIYEKKREKAETRREQRIASLYKAYPKLEKLDRDIKKAGADLLLEVIEPGRPQVAADLKRRLENQRLDFLKENHIDPDFDSARYECDICGDTGYVGDKPCRCYRTVVIPLLSMQANIKPLEGATFAQFDFSLFSDQPQPDHYRSPRSPREQIQGIKAAAEQFIASFSLAETRNMLFVGSPGTGKTYMMGCIGHALIEKGISVLYISAPQLFDAMAQRRTLRSTFSPDPTRLEQADTLYELILESSLLMIDDLGTEVQASARYSDLLAVIDGRQKPELKTIISSNAEPSALRDTYDERILSRLVGQFSVYRFYGEDVRLEQSRRRRQQR